VNARKALLSFSAVLALTLTSCGTAMRAGKDVLIGNPVSVVALMLYGGTTDGLADARSIREGTGSNGVVEVLAFPLTFAYHAIEHGIWSLAYLVDLPLCAFYWMGELHPSDVAPLDIYDNTPFDYWYRSFSEGGTDPESGEMVPTGR